MVRFAKKIRPLIFSLLWTSLLLYYYNLFILGIHAAYVTLFHFRSPKGQFQNCVFDHNFSILWVNGTNWIAFHLFFKKIRWKLFVFLQHLSSPIHHAWTTWLSNKRKSLKSPSLWCVFCASTFHGSMSSLLLSVITLKKFS